MVAGSPIFITGTDTDVGKTWVSACICATLLARGQRVTLWKPIQTGVTSLEQTDPAQAARWVGPVEGFNWDCSLLAPAPAAPSVALDPTTWQMEDLLVRAKDLANSTDSLVVEGAGGALVPIRPYWDMTGLMRRLAAKAVVVIRPNLGTINHTLLTLEALDRRGIEVAGVVINEVRPMKDEERQSLAVQTLLTQLQAYAPQAKVLGWMPYQQTLPAGCLAPHTPQSLAILKDIQCNSL
jgi:dethiobiotin synthetase